jgi:hypothetical protein
MAINRTYVTRTAALASAVLLLCLVPGSFKANGAARITARPGVYLGELPVRLILSSDGILRLRFKVPTRCKNSDGSDYLYKYIYFGFSTDLDVGSDTEPTEQPRIRLIPGTRKFSSRYTVVGRNGTSSKLTWTLSAQGQFAGKKQVTGTVTLRRTSSGIPGQLDYTCTTEHPWRFTAFRLA